MKSSGVEWIGEIPDEWEVKKFKYFFDIYGGSGFKEEYQGQEKGDFPFCKASDINGAEKNLTTARNYVSQELVDKESYIVIPKNSILVSKIGEALKKNHRKINLVNCIVDNNCEGFVLNSKNEINYLYYVLKCIDMSWFDNGGTIPSVNNFKLKNFFLPNCLYDHQQRIASYLDKKCSKIEETIQNQQQVIEKLKTYKQSLITEAVTGKIKIQNEIPDFKYCNLGFIAEFKNGLNYNASDFGTEVKFLGVGDFQNYLVLNDESMFSNIITDTEIEDDYYLKNGDIIFVRSNGSKELVGRAIMVDNIDFKLTYSGFCICLRNKEPQKINSKFLLYFFRSDHFRNELQRLSQGSNISNINQDLLSHIKIPLVEMRFQESVIDFLNKKCTAIDTAIEQKQNLIEKLTEYKKSLIYECVTGKKEI